MLSGQPRKASVYAVGKATCFYITRPTFKRILGPLQGFLEGNMDKYAKYQDAMKDAATENEDEQPKEEDEDTHNAAKQEKKPKVRVLGLGMCPTVFDDHGLVPFITSSNPLKQLCPTGGPQA